MTHSIIKKGYRLGDNQCPWKDEISLTSSLVWPMHYNVLSCVSNSMLQKSTSSHNSVLYCYSKKNQLYGGSLSNILIIWFSPWLYVWKNYLFPRRSTQKSGALRDSNKKKGFFLLLFSFGMINGLPAQIGCSIRESGCWGQRSMHRWRILKGYVRKGEAHAGIKIY